MERASTCVCPLPSVRVGAVIAQSTIRRRNGHGPRKTRRLAQPGATPVLSATPMLTVVPCYAPMKTNVRTGRPAHCCAGSRSTSAKKSMWGNYVAGAGLCTFRAIHLKPLLERLIKDPLQQVRIVYGTESTKGGAGVIRSIRRSRRAPTAREPTSLYRMILSRPARLVSFIDTLIHEGFWPTPSFEGGLMRPSPRRACSSRRPRSPSHAARKRLTQGSQRHAHEGRRLLFSTRGAWHVVTLLHPRALLGRDCPFSSTGAGRAGEPI